MPRPFQLAALVGLLASQWALISGAGADSHQDIDYAEFQPLVTESMLLDITGIDGRLVAVGERGHVLFSDDGSSWQQAEHVPTRSTLTSVIAIGGRLWAGGHDAVIITSGDRGKTWSRQFYAPERQQAVMDFHFTDENNGVAMGSYGLSLETSDGGRTWTENLVDPENDFHLNDVIALPDGRRMIAGEAGYSYRSSDDGRTWEALELPYIGSMWGAIASSDDCVVFYGLRGHALESCDFGATWRELDTGTLSSLSGAARWEDLLVLVGNSGVILELEDGRISQNTHSSGVDFSSVISLGDGRFLLVGEEGVHVYPEQAREGSTP